MILKENKNNRKMFIVADLVSLNLHLLPKCSSKKTILWNVFDIIEVEDNFQGKDDIEKYDYQ